MANLLIWAIIILVVLGGVVAVIVAGIGATHNSEEDDPLMARLAEATQPGDVVSSLEEIEMQQPFSQRVLLPLLLVSVNFNPLHSTESIGGYGQKN